MKNKKITLTLYGTFIGLLVGVAANAIEVSQVQIRTYWPDFLSILCGSAIGGALGGYFFERYFRSLRSMTVELMAKKALIAGAAVASIVSPIGVAFAMVFQMWSIPRFVEGSAVDFLLKLGNSLLFFVIYAVLTPLMGIQWWLMAILAGAAGGFLAVAFGWVGEETGAGPSS